MKNYFLKRKEQLIDHYANAWVNNDIAEKEERISQLIYQRNLSESKVNDFLNFGNDSDFGDSGWASKGEMNFPGPFYTADTDTCGTGIIESPNNVVFDEDGLEYVMIQPRTRVELEQLWNAGAVEVLGGYFCDGNDQWTIALVKDWWRNRNDVISHLKNKELIQLNCNQDRRYDAYLKGEAKIDLQRYCFFLDNGFYPLSERLPELE